MDDRRPAEKRECRPPRDVPDYRRSSFVRRDVGNDKDGWGAHDYAILLARLFVPDGFGLYVRRITVGLFAAEERESTWDVHLPSPDEPDWWHTPGQTTAQEWDWAWNLGRAPVDDQTRAENEGTQRQFAPGEAREHLGPMSWWIAPWQRLADSVGYALHGTCCRFYFEGPCVAQLWAVLTCPVVGHDRPEIPFGLSFGSLEGALLPIDRILDNPDTWTTP